MPFPDEIEDGTGTEASKARIGLAGPTADVRHLEVHDAAGLPSMIVTLQQQIGTERSVQSWTPTWSTTPTGTVDAKWARYGPFVWFSVFAQTFGDTFPGLQITGGIPWGIIQGNGEWFTGFYTATGESDARTMLVDVGSTMTFYREYPVTDAITEIALTPLYGTPISSVRFAGVLYTG